MTSLRTWLAPLSSALLVAAGCANTFDPALYQAGAVPLDLADDCTVDSMIPDVTFAEGNRAFIIDTHTLQNDIEGTRSCLDRLATGPEGFLRVRMQANERWHFHMRRRGTEDPALYILPSCDVRQCMESRTIDICRSGADEHLTFEAPSAGTYLVAVDSASAEGVSGTLQVIHPICGNGTQEHSETCDDGGTIAGDGCDENCRYEIRAGTPSEFEANDDSFSANHLLLSADGSIFATGEVGASCEVDWYAVDIASGQTIDVNIETAEEMPCTADRPARIALELIDPSGRVVLANTTGSATTCPAITAFTPPGAGLHFIRVFASNDEIARYFNYGLRVRVR
jgi:cysteine-rich repeat protein